MLYSIHTLPTYNAPPKRIVSVVPSLSELLYDLGVDDEVIGITKFCIHPESWFRSKKRIGGTKNLNLEAIAELNPDLILANKEENTQAEIEKLAEDYTVLLSDINSLSDALIFITSLGAILSKQEEAKQLKKAINLQVKAIQKNTLKLKTLYLIWKNPWMAVGTQTFINSLLNVAGFENALQQFPENEYGRYPVLETEFLPQIQTDVIFLSSEPYPFKEKHIKELQLIFPNAKILCIDGEIFSWYGSRLRFINHHLSAINQRILYI